MQTDTYLSEPFSPYFPLKPIFTSKENESTFQKLAQDCRPSNYRFNNLLLKQIISTAQKPINIEFNPTRKVDKCHLLNNEKRNCLTIKINGTKGEKQEKKRISFPTKMSQQLVFKRRFTKNQMNNVDNNVNRSRNSQRNPIKTAQSQFKQFNINPTCSQSNRKALCRSLEIIKKKNKNENKGITVIKIIQESKNRRKIKSQSNSTQNPIHYCQIYQRDIQKQINVLKSKPSYSALKIVQCKKQILQGRNRTIQCTKQMSRPKSRSQKSNNTILTRINIKIGSKAARRQLSSQLYENEKIEQWKIPHTTLYSENVNNEHFECQFDF